MKTKLTLNIENSVIRKTKKLSKKRKKSMSAMVEEYLAKITSGNNQTDEEETFTQRFRKQFPAKPLKNYDYKKVIDEYRDKKYGRN